MEHPEFPPNSDVSKRATQDKKIERVTSGEATRRRRSLRKQLKDVFVGGTIRDAMHFVVLEVLLPAAKDMVVEAGSQGIEKLIFGEGRRYRGITRPPSGPTGHIQYNRYASPQMPSSRRALSRRARSEHNFDEIVLDSREEAEEVIDRLFDLVSRYDTATVSDLYELVGLSSTFTDNQWGWTDLRGAGVQRIRDGYLLDLPDPDPLN
jgi:hypothetical protein